MLTIFNAKSLRAILLIVPLTCLSCRTTISGQLLSQSGQPLHKVTGKVNITSLSNDSLHEIVTVDNEGQFATNIDIQPGEYYIEPLVPGYDAKPVKVKVDADRRVTLFAEPIKERPSKALGTGDGRNQDRGSGGALIAPPKF